MSTNQKYSVRIHTRRQLVSTVTHLQNASKSLAQIGTRYENALPRVSLACDEMIKMLSMVEALVEDIRENI